ncbi:MAG: hypothetical protein JKY48_08645 [Flavobacteriales bacterium]|nr:hypothetical protein [Flavobacteriales bacterium]
MTRIKTYILNMKILIMLSVLPFLLTACIHTNKKSGQEQQRTYSQPTNIATNLHRISELTPEQQSAFNALNELQISTDEMNRLYSTFAGIVQACYPPDTSLTISQSELLIAMNKFVTSNCKNLTVKKRYELTTTAVLAQEQYTLLICLDNLSNVDYENGAPTTGTWIIASVLGLRDVIIVW